MNMNIVAVRVDEMTAHLSVRIDAAGKDVQCSVYELAHDGSIADTPVAVGSFCSGNHGRAEVNVRIGTPMFWTQEVPHLYVAVVDIGTGSGVSGRRCVRFGVSRTDGLTRVAYASEIPPLPMASDLSLPTIHVIGDSTAARTWINPNQQGWGEPLKDCFDPTKVKVLNRAKAGRSSRTFIREGLWERALAGMKPDDMALIQFGHNDADTLDQGRCRGMLPGYGSETVEVTLPDGTKEMVQTFGWYLRRMISEAQAKGVTPVLLSPTAKNIWKDDLLGRDQGPYGRWSAEVAAEEDVPFIDLVALITAKYDLFGSEFVARLYCDATDTVHTSHQGANLNAELCLCGIEADGGGTIWRK